MTRSRQTTVRSNLLYANFASQVRVAVRDKRRGHPCQMTILGRQPGGVFVAEDPHRLLKLLHLKRFL